MINSVKYKKIISEYVEGLHYIKDKEKEDLLNFHFIKNDDSIYLCYPVLFKSYFIGIKDKDFNKLCVAGYLLYRYSLCMDSIIDSNLNEFSKAKLFYDESIKILNSIYDKNSFFWKIFNKRKKEFSIVSEGQFSDVKLSINDYEKIASGKSVLGKLAIDSLFCLSKKNNIILYKKLLRSHDDYSIGIQIQDDIIDIKEDLINKQVNYLINFYMDKDLREAKYHHNFINLLYVKGEIENVLNLSKKYFEKAKMVSSSYNNKWVNIINHRISLTNEKLSQLHEYIDGHKKTNSIFSIAFEERLQLYSSKTSIISLAKNLFQLIKFDFENNYILTDHRMYLSRYDGFKKSRIIKGTIFSRTMILNNLVEFKHCYNNEFNSIINLLSFENRNHLLQNKSRGILGGWKYFPSLRELSIDIDDLAEVGKFFYNYNFFNELNSTILPIIQHINKYSTCTSLGVPKTWIIPKSSHPYYLKQIAMNKKWGDGPDIEVVANYMLLLARIDKLKYADTINKGIFYINKSISDGFWSSRWYYGPFYGTYIATIFLNFMNNLDCKIRDSIITFVKKTQCHDGSWSIGQNKKGDLLSTSLALLILKNINYTDVHITDKGLRYMKNNIINLKKLSPPFIIPKFGSNYSSYTITASFCIKTIISYDSN